MNDRKVTVNEADLRSVLAADIHSIKAAQRLRVALDALGPEPCGHWSSAFATDECGNDHPLFRCIAPKGHHAFDHRRPCCDEDNPDAPIHCGDAHQPPADVWAES